MYQRLIILLLSASALWSCETHEAKETRLAKTYCGSCHGFPEPALLSNKIWLTSVLPEMKFRMGFPDRGKLRRYSEHDQRVIRSLLPERPILSEDDFQSIVRYYERNAPDSLSTVASVLTTGTGQFAAEIHSLNRYPLITMVAIDTMKKQIITGTRFGELLFLNEKSEETDSLLLPSPPSGILLHQSNMLALTMGIMDPNDEFKGQLFNIDGDRKKHLTIDSLQRPVSMESADLDGNAASDLIVCAFGNYTGSLVVYEGQRDGSYVKHVISNLPGARRVLVQDVDRNGLPDIVALFAQGDEHLALFLNQGNFKFERKILLRFPPVYGSTWFEIHDMNKDGHFDIVYTNGDNADYSPEVKPYHGVRYYENNGDNTFTEKWFYPMPGASQVRRHDFDLDGDDDLLAIAWFPDYIKNPEAALIFFENQKNGFMPHLVPESKSGRWITMDTGDIDGDGDTDAVIGALNFEQGVPGNILMQWQQRPASLLVLRNNTR